MFKKIAILIALMLMFAGCGSDKLVGDWKVWRSGVFGDGQDLYIVHIEKSDNGTYLLTQERQYYSHESGRDRNKKGQVLTTGRDEILNAKEAIAISKDSYGFHPSWRFAGDTPPKWTGVPLKITKRYKRGGTKYNQISQFNKENLPLKDGKLIFNNMHYEKTDKDGIDKEMANYKEKLKKLVGKETTCKVSYVEGEMKADITKVTIIENGIEEVFD